MLNDPWFSQLVVYLEGSALTEIDLRRSRADIAMAFFIVTNKFSANPDEEDAKALLHHLSIVRYCNSSVTRRQQTFCLQLIRPENQRHLPPVAKNSKKDIIVVCLNEVKMNLLAKSVLCTGTNTLLMNLVSSFTEGDDEEDEEEVEEGIKSLSGILLSHVIGKDDSEPPPPKTPIREKIDWISEYKAGCDWEIYTTPLSDIFKGAKFVDLAYMIYERLGVVVFALQVTEKKTNTSKLLLNPAAYFIPSKEDYDIKAFVIARNAADSDLNFAAEPEDEVEGKVAIPTYIKKYATIHLNSRKVAGEDSSDSTTVPSTGSTAVNSDESVVAKTVTRNASRMTGRKTLLQERAEKDSIQERLKKMEDHHFASGYYIRANPALLEDCSVKTSLLEEHPSITNHLIIMGKSPKHLYDLILPLRAKYLGILRYIVILYPDEIPQNVWRKISVFECILVVKGTCLEEVDIHRAGIFRASQVVILSDSKASSSTEKPTNPAVYESLVDSEAIFTYQCVKRLNPVTKVVLEILRYSNISYFDKEAIFSKEDYKFTPQFASGTLFTTSLLDTLVCQAFFNPQIINIVNKIACNVETFNHEDALIKLIARNKILLDIESEKPAATAFRNCVGSSLYLMSVPESLAKKSYGALFQYLTQQDQIPLGLLREIFPHLGMGPKSNSMPYVYTNPDKNTSVFVCDKIFVLSTTPIVEAERQIISTPLHMQGPKESPTPILRKKEIKGWSSKLMLMSRITGGHR